MSKIEWTEQTWNPVTGCSKVATGCKNCYAETLANRFWGERKFTDVRCHPERLGIPLRRKKPTMYFVNSMSDLFHDAVPDDFIYKVFAVMALRRRHTFQVLTKRHARMNRLLSLLANVEAGSFEATQWDAARRWLQSAVGPKEREYIGIMMADQRWPLPNVWLGCSASTQADLDALLPDLMATPAAVRFLSLEPLIERIDVRTALATGAIHWVIVGGESGPGARACDVAWIAEIIKQCRAAETSCYTKQLGSYPILDPRYDRSLPGSTRRLSRPKGGDPDEWPEALRVREFPKKGEGA